MSAPTPSALTPLSSDLPRPRTLAMRETPEFAHYNREILDLLLARGVLREH